MKIIVLILVFLSAQAIAASSADARTPVIVELFTSEGCSSCPPADDMLAQLEKLQPVPGARVIALEEHVDYWNNLGWKDPFSSSQFRGRQTGYAQSLRIDNIYTPQMVVNGRAEFVGDSMDRAVAEIDRAAMQSVAAVQLRSRPNAKDPDLTDLTVKVTDLPPVRIGGKRGGQLEVWLAVTEANLSTNVPRGENAGRTLRHAAVVRSIGVIGTLDPREKQAIELRPTLKFPREWKRRDLRAVVFVQEQGSRRIAGAETLNLH